MIPPDDPIRPDFIKTVRMLRTERDYSFQQAKDEAIRMFDQRGWPVPESMRRINVSSAR